MPTRTQTRSAPSRSKPWTPVDQKLPDDEISVLVANAAQEDYAVAFHTGEPFDSWRYADNGLLLPWTVTHWMDLPPLP